jgi:sulfate transport system substrate-binding protein
MKRCGSLLALALAGSAFLPQQPARAAGAHLVLVAYSTPAAAYAQLIPAFQKTAAGQGITITPSYGPSGDQSQAVANGQPADVVNFSLAPDVLTLVHRGLIASSWNKNAYAGMVTDSTVVFVVRKGNPKHIATWNDLIKKGVDVITPNPFTSGSARWNVMAAYGAQLKQKKTRKQAVAYLQKLFDNVSVQPTSASNAMTTFTTGKGDVLLSYEDDAITAIRKGLPIQYVTPPQSILIENPAAVVKSTRSPVQARAFLDFLTSKSAQKIWGQNGYRPVRKDVLTTFHFRNPKVLFTIHYLGAWPNVETQFFDPEYGIMASIERKKGITP